jgi:hypothetical protein
MAQIIAILTEYKLPLRQAYPHIFGKMCTQVSIKAANHYRVFLRQALQMRQVLTVLQSSTTMISSGLSVCRSTAVTAYSM